MTSFKTPPRMALWAVLYLVLFALASFLRDAQPSSLLAVTVYKAHMLALGGWLGYWLDRALFPYDRPHTYLEESGPPLPSIPGGDEPGPFLSSAESIPPTFGHAMLRRAIVVAACLICVGLGA